MFASRSFFAAAPFNVTIAPPTVTGFGVPDSAGGLSAATTGFANAAVAGGVGPFTYAWTYVSGENASILGATSAAARFRRTAAGLPDFTDRELTGIFACTVTDTGSGGQQATAQVTAVTTHSYD